jgi:hypothetical protein
VVAAVASWRVLCRRYIFDMYSRYKRIDKPLYDWCVKHRLVDAQLVAKWKKPGYERLCSTIVINPKNYNFGTTSICRVPKFGLGDSDRVIVGNSTGCLGCASGPGGFSNIFGNKYGQNLADIQMCRERGKLQERGLWDPEEAEKRWRERGGGSTKKRARLEVLALPPNGEVWASEEEEELMLRTKRDTGLVAPHHEIGEDVTESSLVEAYRKGVAFADDEDGKDKADDEDGKDKADDEDGKDEADGDKPEPAASETATAAASASASAPVDAGTNYGAYAVMLREIGRDVGKRANRDDDGEGNAPKRAKFTSEEYLAD